MSNDVFKLPAAEAAGMSTDDDLGMVDFGLSTAGLATPSGSVSALATPSGSLSTASVKPRFTSPLVNAEPLASVTTKKTFMLANHTVFPRIHHILALFPVSWLMVPRTPHVPSFLKLKQ